MFDLRHSAVGWAAIAGALGLAVFSAGIGWAAPDNPNEPAPPVPVIPGPDVQNMPTLEVPGYGPLTNPFYTLPPDQWDDVTYVNPQDIYWLPPGYPNLTTPLQLVWNGAANSWGVFVGGDFVAYPILLPSPNPVH